MSLNLSKAYWKHPRTKKIQAYTDYVIYEGEYYLTSECNICESCRSFVPKSLPLCHEIDRKIIRRWHSGAAKEKFYGNSRFSIGFEVEKNEIEGHHADSQGRSVSEAQPLWARIETDSSCGLELISNVYSTRGIGAKLFKEHLAESSYVDCLSNKTCGGHIGISDSKEKLTIERFRPVVPVLYAAFYKRLKNGYTRENQKSGGGTDHSSAIAQKDFGIECRLPDAVDCAETLQRRFDFMSTVVQLLRRKPEELTPEVLFNATRKAYTKLTDATPKDITRYKFLIDGFYDVVVKGESNSVLETGAFYGR